MRKTSLLDTFKDDKTRMWSFSRISGAFVLAWVVVVCTCLIWMDKTVSTNIYKLAVLFVGYSASAYGINKGFSHFSRLNDYDYDEDITRVEPHGE